MNFEIWPALDLIDGKVVRLYKGSFAQKTEYPVQPTAQAQFFAKTGATGLHVVDLTGAKLGKPQNFKTLQKICQAVEIPVELGGGIRTLATAEKVFAAGVQRIIVATAVIERPKFLTELMQKFGPAKIVVGIDARQFGTKIATHGWLQKGNLDTLDFAKHLAAQGVKNVIFTDIARDGTLTYPNFEMAEKLVQIPNLKILVAGGVTQKEHVQSLKKIGCAGVVLGKALYEGKTSVQDLVAAAKTTNHQ